MQVLIEGVALAAFSMVRDFTQDPLGKAVTAYIMQDEARHIAFGRMALKDAYAELTEAEREEREEFVIEGSYLLRDRFLAREVWETLGMDADKMVATSTGPDHDRVPQGAVLAGRARASRTSGCGGRRSRQPTPTWACSTSRTSTRTNCPSATSDVAEEMERMLAEKKANGFITDNGSRGAALAQTVAAADD
jgi:hypothetical protein